MAQKLSFWESVKKALMCLAVLVMMQSAVAPAPARAEIVIDILEFATKVISWVKEAAGWVAMKAALIYERASIIAYSYALNYEFIMLADKVQSAFMAKSVAQSLSSKIDGQIADANVDSMVKTGVATLAMELAAEEAPSASSALCKNAFAHLLPLTGEAHALEVSRNIVDAVSGRGLCKGCSGNDMGYAAWESAFRHGQAAPGATKDSTKAFGNAVDGIEEGIASYSSMVDADLLGAMTDLTIPDVTGSGSSKKYNPTTERQVAYMAALNHCMHVAGPRESPSRDANLNTPTGLIQRAMFNHCAANESVLIKQCGDKIAFNARPNCTQSPELCEQQNVFCGEAVKNSGNAEKYGNCEEGLSPRESFILEQMMCKAQQHYIDQTLAHAPTKDQYGTVTRCSMAWDAWEALAAKKEENFLRAVGAIGSLDSCWSAVESLGPGGGR